MEEKVNPSIFEAFRKIKNKDYASAKELLENGLKKSEADNTITQTGLFYSALGVLAKVQKDFKEAWRCYEKAEKSLPDDPSLKIIMARLLMDQFSQHDTAIKKLKQVLQLAKGSGSFEHQAHAIMAVAYLKKGDRKKAIQMFELSMEKDFQSISSSENLNFEVLEAFLGRNLHVDRCRHYVEKAITLAKSRKEKKQIQFLTKLLESFPEAMPAMASPDSEEETVCPSAPPKSQLTEKK